MIWFAFTIAALAVLTVVLCRRLRGDRCPECRAPRRLKDGSRAAFCPDCGHWFDPRLVA